MENTDGLIKVFFSGTLPKEKYTDANELASDIADALSIDKSKLVVELISLPDIKGEKGDKGDKGNQGPKGDDGQGVEYQGEWAEDIAYTVLDVVQSGGKLFVCNGSHTSTSDTEPEVGASWEDVWDVMLELPSEIVVDSITIGSGGTPLDSYIDDVWTPEVSVSGGTAPDFSSVNGKYTKIGKWVTCRIELINSSGGTAGSGAGPLSVSLPIECSNFQLLNIVPAGYCKNDSTVRPVLIQKVPSGLSFVVYVDDPATELTGADLNHANTRELYLEFTYEV